jgi:hypothetical protein
MTSSLPEALLTFGPTLVAAEANVVERAVAQGREVPARAVAVMPQREREEEAVAETALAGFAGNGEDMKNALHGRTMPLCERSALRRKPKHLLE